MRDFLYVGLSFVFVFMLIGFSTLLKQLKWLPDESSRKFVHIGVSHWIFFILLFENVIFALIPPVAFILLNYLSYRKNIFKAIERNGKRNLATVYFAIALLLVVLFTFLIGENKVYAPAAIGGMLVLGYGDGLASLVGQRWGKTRLLNGKSFEGSLTFFFTSGIILLLITWLFIPNGISNSWWFIPLSALIITLVELLTPLDLDNASIPIITTSLLWFLMQA